MTLAASVEPPIRDQSFRPPPACFGLGQLTRHNVLMLKELNLATIPVVYGEEYYDYLIVHPTFCRLAYLGDVMVGGITCRVETNPDGVKQLYIMTLSVLKPYRRHGIATQLLGYILELASSRGDIEVASLHVWEANTEARRFYEKRGFKSVSREENHYPDMEPPHAVYMQCQLPWAFKGAVPLVMPDFDATKHNLSQFKQPDHK
ncbi:acetyltransferase domain-containing protein [Cyclospora cayetanensis]|uniref:Acetyltransferase domain-containing protein n=1 Tax=Cyclospora cayetanensis TaxID=88456 RepID=A0A1D3CRM1_9EIME|nr:acetyltransferase domain-containing protein [Cyclospora cayetanensis]